MILIIALSILLGKRAGWVTKAVQQLYGLIAVSNRDWKLAKDLDIWFEYPTIKDTYGYFVRLVVNGKKQCLK